MWKMESRTIPWKLSYICHCAVDKDIYSYSKYQDQDLCSYSCVFVDDTQTTDQASCLFHFYIEQLNCLWEVIFFNNNYGTLNQNMQALTHNSGTEFNKFELVAELLTASSNSNHRFKDSWGFELVIQDLNRRLVAQRPAQINKIRSLISVWLIIIMHMH